VSVHCDHASDFKTAKIVTASLNRAKPKSNTPKHNNNTSNPHTATPDNTDNNTTPETPPANTKRGGLAPRRTWAAQGRLANIKQQQTQYHCGRH
jgi:heme-binding NEAT domain protein